MKNLPDTSFMPQQPLLRVETGMRRKEPLNPAFVIALVVFFVMIAVSGGVYFYKQQIVARVQAKAQELEDAEKLLNIDQIESYKNVNTRITTARTLIQNHTVFNTVLKLIERTTAQNVTLTALGYSTNDGKIIMNIAAQAPSYESAYFQAEVWRSLKKEISQVDISGISLAEDTGIVSFTGKIALNQDVVNYAKSLQEENRVRAEASLPVAPPVTNP